MAKPKDISELTFGRLIAKCPTKDRDRDGSVMWFCQCKCGGNIIVSINNLQTGNTRSCGCLRREVASTRNRKDISEKRFGRLTAKYPTDERSSGSIKWSCICDCGNTCTVATGALTSGNTNSCGCILKEMAGSNSPLWNPNLTDVERKQNRDTLEDRQWRHAVFKRDNYTCQKCGQRGGQLEAHHVENWADYPELRYDIDNGITFCETCHRKKDIGFHSIYGVRSNTHRQLDEYLGEMR